MSERTNECSSLCMKKAESWVGFAFLGEPSVLITLAKFDVD